MHDYNTLGHTIGYSHWPPIIIIADNLQSYAYCIAVKGSGQKTPYMKAVIVFGPVIP